MRDNERVKVSSRMITKRSDGEPCFMTETSRAGNLTYDEMKAFVEDLTNEMNRILENMKNKK